MAILTATLLALLGGIIPTLIWLAYWLLEDRHEPEPKRVILFIFLIGMAVIVPALIAERIVANIIEEGIILFVAWAVIEELAKFFAAYFGGLRTRFYDEPLDAVIYLITAALGFAALENALFLLPSLFQERMFFSFATGELRFVGATLLHTLASATLGLSIAFTFYKSKVAKIIAI